LLKSLTKVLGVVGRGTDLFDTPVLGNVLVRLGAGGQMFVTGTDRQIEITAVSTVPDGSTLGMATLPARKLTEILRSLPEGTQLTLTVDKDRATIKAPGSRFVLATLPPTDFPLVTVPAHADRTVSIEAKQLATLMRQCSHAMGYQDVRQFLNSMLMEVRNGRFHCVASDGHRLSIASVSIPGAVNERLLISRKAAEQLLVIVEKADGVITLEMAERMLRVQTDGLTFITNLIDGQFPDYSAVVPGNLGSEIIVKRQPLIDAIERVDILADEKHHAVAINITRNTIKVEGQNKEKEDAQDALDAATTIEDMRVGFNAGYLLDALRAVPTDDVRLCVRGNAQSMVLTPTQDIENLTQVIMPVRL